MLHDAFSKPQLLTSSPLVSKTLAELTHISMIRHSLATLLALWRQPESTLPTPNAPKMGAPGRVSLQAQNPAISALSCPSSSNVQQQWSRASSCQPGFFTPFVPPCIYRCLSKSLHQRKATVASLIQTGSFRRASLADSGEQS